MTCLLGHGPMVRVLPPHPLPRAATCRPAALGKPPGKLGVWSACPVRALYVPKRAPCMPRAHAKCTLCWASGNKQDHACALLEVFFGSRVFGLGSRCVAAIPGRGCGALISRSRADGSHGVAASPRCWWVVRPQLCDLCPGPAWLFSAHSDLWVKRKHLGRPGRTEDPQARTGKAEREIPAGSPKPLSWIRPSDWVEVKMNLGTQTTKPLGKVGSADQNSIVLSPL